MTWILHILSRKRIDLVCCSFQWPSTATPDNDKNESNKKNKKKEKRKTGVCVFRKHYNNFESNDHECIMKCASLVIPPKHARNDSINVCLHHNIAFGISNAQNAFSTSACIPSKWLGPWHYSSTWQQTDNGFVVFNAFAGGEEWMQGALHHINLVVKSNL